MWRCISLRGQRERGKHFTLFCLFLTGCDSNDKNNVDGGWMVTAKSMIMIILNVTESQLLNRQISSREHSASVKGLWLRLCKLLCVFNHAIVHKFFIYCRDLLVLRLQLSGSAAPVGDGGHQRYQQHTHTSSGILT